MPINTMNQHAHNVAMTERPWWCPVCVSRRASELGLKAETIGTLWMPRLYPREKGRPLLWRSLLQRG